MFSPNRTIRYDKTRVHGASIAVKSTGAARQRSEKRYSVEKIAAPGRRGRDRRAEIMRAAKAVFLERGYTGASTDAIVERSGGSKETIYAHFGSKLGLFRAVLLEKIDVLFAWEGDFDAGSAEQMLLAAGQSVARAVDEELLKLGRIVAGEIDRIPDLAAQLGEIGRDHLCGEISRSLTRRQERGDFPAGDTKALAEVFLDLLGGALFLRPLFDPALRLTPVKAEVHVRTCVAVVMRLATPIPAVPPFNAAPLGPA
jgi:AcrR family transcriptional regulator